MEWLRTFKLPLKNVEASHLQGRLPEAQGNWRSTVCLMVSRPIQKIMEDGEKSTCSNRDRLPLRCNETLPTAWKTACSGFSGNGSKVQELPWKVKKKKKELFSLKLVWCFMLGTRNEILGPASSDGGDLTTCLSPSPRFSEVHDYFLALSTN